MDEIMVSVCCSVYNHEKYLRKCLDGFIMQKTNFKFEVLIHDDASTDNSAEIIREYERKYPNMIKPIYQKENQYSKKVKINLKYQYPRAKGKYIALCEGDDYWCDEKKLQMQFDAMETNPDCVLCVHITRHIDENGNLRPGRFPDFKITENIIPKQKFQKIMVSERNYPFHTSSYFIQTQHLKEVAKGKVNFIMQSKVGDIPLLMYLATKGSVFYIPKEMSRYRLQSIGSYSERVSNNPKFQEAVFRKQIECYRLYDEYTSYAFHNEIEVLLLRYEFRIYVAYKDWNKIRQKRFRKFFDEFTVKRKIYLFLCYVFPFTETLYNQYILFIKKLKRNNKKTLC